ncbi:MAG: CHASE2 domain-containing protein [Aequorivita sp.]|nr:CHASE2 domain-containing protein [Aequorivita sp.]
MKLKRNTKLLLKDSILCTLFAFFIIFVLSFLVINISFFDPLKKVVKDFSFLDVYYAENFNPTHTVNQDIVLINIEHRDRFELAQLLSEVLKADPKVVGVDIIFKDRKEGFIDTLVAKTLHNDKVITSYIIGKDSLINNDSLFLNKKNSGFVNLNFENQESVVREFAGITQFQNQKHLSFASKIAHKVLGKKAWEAYSYDDKFHGTTPIKYTGDYTSFLNFGYEEFMESENKAILRNKIVLLGYLGSPTGNIYDVEDKLFTPLNKITAGKSVPDMFGVVIHANIINMLLKNDLMYRVPNFWIGVFSFICTFFTIMYFLWLGKRKKITESTVKKIVLFLFTVILTGLALWLFKMGIILKVVPIIGITLIGSSYISYYKHLIDYIKTKMPWESYFR